MVPKQLWRSGHKIQSALEGQFNNLGEEVEAEERGWLCQDPSCAWSNDTRSSHCGRCEAPRVGLRRNAPPQGWQSASVLLEGWGANTPSRLKSCPLQAKPGITCTDAGDKYQTALLPIGKTIPVYMSECLTPSKFFVTIIANMELLQKLEQELTQWAEKGGSDLSFQPSVGQVMMASLEEGEGWVRTRVMEVLGEGRVKVFCVDTGETAVVEAGSLGPCPCPPHLARRLPFQGLPCSLEGWEGRGCSSDGGRLFDLTREEGSDEAMVLHCSVVSRGEEGDLVRLSCGAEDLAHMMKEAGL